jgi:hypothetical protein
VGSELLRRPGDAVGEHVVAKVHDEVVVPQERAGQRHAVGEAEWPLLGDVGNPRAELLAVADFRGDLGSVVTGHDPDFGEAEPTNVVQHVGQHGPSGNRYQLLGH